MVNKIIITESQYNRLFKHRLKENLFDIVLNELLSDLNKNYEKVTAIVNDYHDYNEKPRFKVKVDGNVITAKELLEYMKYKYHEKCGENFIKQVIDDWFNDKIKDGFLSKNITLN
jgi:hypothetical protein